MRGCEIGATEARARFLFLDGRSATAVWKPRSSSHPRSTDERFTMKRSISPLLVIAVTVAALLALPRVGYNDCCQLAGSCFDPEDFAACDASGGTFSAARTCVGST